MHRSLQPVPQRVDVGLQWRIELLVVGGMVADDVDDRAVRATGVVQVRQPIRHSRSQVQQRGRGLAGDPGVAVGSTGGHAFEQTQHRPHLGEASKAATKCISDVPGLAKHTSTPPAIRRSITVWAPVLMGMILPSIGLSRGNIPAGHGRRTAIHSQCLRRRCHVHAQIVLFDGFDPLDVIAPFEVLAAGSEAVGGELEVELVSAEGPRPVVSGTRGHGVDRRPRSSIRRSPATSSFPARQGPIDGDPDEVDTIPVLLARFGETEAVPLMRDAMANPDVTVATVCGGSLALAMAGLLEGRNAVTHQLGLDVLEATGVNVVHARVVDDGDLVTAGGVTSGLDLALHLLDRSYGPRVRWPIESLFAYERRGTVWT